MNALRTLCIALALAFAVPAQADSLPDPKAAEAALWASPRVAQARAELAVQTLKGQGLQRGREEWNVGADVARRSIDSATRDNRAEWGLALSRPLRLPARAAADRALAGAAVAQAEASLGEALHESGRQLLALWFAWLGEADQAKRWKAQHDVATEQLAVVNARIRLGEAPRAERANAEAALAQARLQAQQAASRAQQARSRVLAHYPALVVPADLELSAPVPPEGGAEAHVEAALAHNHELAQARRHAARLRAEARQLASQRGVDPSLGVYYRNEGGGEEQVIGLNVGLTLPGPARRYEQHAAEQSSVAAEAAAVALEHRLRQEARADFEAAVAAFADWQLAERAAEAQEEAARLAARAYGLGEGELDSVLMTRRLALETRLQARQAQVVALAAEARLRLDSHRLWSLDLDTVADGRA